MGLLYTDPSRYVYDGAGSSGGKNVLDFYSNPAAAQLFKEHMAALVTRTNTFTGVQYRDDPAVRAGPRGDHAGAAADQLAGRRRALGQGAGKLLVLQHCLGKFTPLMLH
jgi:hypothetical protein